MRQRFQGQVVAITGASSGIGREAALAFAREGAKVAVAARRADRLDALAAEIRAAGGHAIAVACDVTRRADVDALADRAVAEWGRLDVFVNNAGVGLAARVLDTGEADFEQLFRVNVLGALYGMQAAARHMRPRGAGAIVNVSSVVGKRALPGNGAYCATKFALQALSDSLRLELGGSGVDVVVVCPGLTDTEFREAQLGSHPGFATPRGVRGMSAARAGRALVDATHRRERERVLTLAAHAVVALERISPALTDRLVRVALKKRL
jgi:NAD(P)-dependent dehydrogenase (short-subunit alcohol dehydrogenase family)